MANSEAHPTDPTKLTTDLIDRALKALSDKVETRLDAMDKAQQLAYEHSRHIPSEVDARFNHLKELHDERFASIATQFKERDVRAAASEAAANTAVNAALQAQKEAAGAQNESNAAAINKSELATVKQIDGIMALLSINTKSTEDKISSINGRLDRDEGKNTGTSSSVVMIIAIIAVVASVGTVIISLLHPSLPLPLVIK